MSVYQPSPINGTLFELYDLRDDNTNCSILNIDEINHLVQTICLDKFFLFFFCFVLNVHIV